MSGSDAPAAAPANTSSSTSVLNIAGDGTNGAKYNLDAAMKAVIGFGWQLMNSVAYLHS